ncbi:hypothetical protein COV04_04250 [Candidatus Uhrbacteria bacterium CG10_big_fil_rev_8_21_14_0_10_48_11]|uniref:CBS domain-containing protein n=1 Tax=Candidatus Uhrbacteria bacterium CG10_big_fil_rev_8_21_14_0_10_48_11 TaxID=1975037 RepID=A0A2M8LDS8_9BACT|nr:MAG: hypothetical protein COV04_04250 [Candidatus Uhrbacteria bacterium CG10_big_fil_rev_8_21_14_0_10_48_11]
MKQYLVQDFMHRSVVTISPTATLRQAVELMIKKKTNGIVVVDEKNCVCGILSSWDVISYIVPDYLEGDKHLASFAAESTFAKRTQALEDHTIDKFMTKHVHTVKPTHSLMAASTLLAKHRIRQLPVVDDAGVVVGYISRTNIKHAIGDVFGIPLETER